jgi:hypothetical protein
MTPNYIVQKEGVVRRAQLELQISQRSVQLLAEVCGSVVVLHKHVHSTDQLLYWKMEETESPKRSMHSSQSCSDAAYYPQNTEHPVILCEE